MDYDLIISQANGRPIMTEYLNKRFKDILADMGSDEINLDDIVFHSIRHTSAGMKLKLSHGDLKAVQAEGGWNTPDMVTKRYAHVIDEDRIKLAKAMDRDFYGNKKEPHEGLSSEIKSFMEMTKDNPDLLTQILKSIQLANKS